MIDIKSFFPLSPHQAVAANEGLLPGRHPLGETDMETIIEEHAVAIGNAIDEVATEGKYDINSYAGAAAVLLRLPELQRWITWYGSSLKRPQIEALSTEDGELLWACIEVIAATRAEYVPEEIAQLLVEALRSQGVYLATEGAR